MCGIIGLLVKKAALRARLGELMMPMLIGVTERGPDSAGLAVFTTPVGGAGRKVSLFCAELSFEWSRLEQELTLHHGALILEALANHAILTVGGPVDTLLEWLRTTHPRVHVLSVGQSIDLYKDVGTPEEVANRYRLSHLSGSHLVGHTRMATESAVTPENAHPYTAGEDWCIVHNGSLSNPHSIRRALEKRGIRFEGDCDTEVACRYIDWRLREGDDLEAALGNAFCQFDGFFTFLMGTRDKLALVRDPFACKPAVVAETDDYVAIASEFRSLALLPGIASANIFEPVPERIYSWSA